MEIERPTTLVNCPPPSGNIYPHYTVPPSSSEPSSSAPSSTSDRLSPYYTYPSLAFTIRYGCASYTDNLVSSTYANNGSSTTSYDSSPFSSYTGVEAIFLVGNASPGSSEAVVKFAIFKPIVGSGKKKKNKRRNKKIKDIRYELKILLRACSIDCIPE